MYGLVIVMVPTIHPLTREKFHINIPVISTILPMEKNYPFYLIDKTSLMSTPKKNFIPLLLVYTYVVDVKKGVTSGRISVIWCPSSTVNLYLHVCCAPFRTGIAHSLCQSSLSRAQSMFRDA